MMFAELSKFSSIRAYSRDFENNSNNQMKLTFTVIILTYGWDRTWSLYLVKYELELKY